MNRILSKFIRHKKEKPATTQVTDLPTVPILDEKSTLEVLEKIKFQNYCTPRIVSAFSQSIGRQRKLNEDALLAITTHLLVHDSVVPLGLYIVADGMGGHRRGEVASELAVRTVATHIMREIHLSLLAPESTPPESSIQEIMSEGIQKAHEVIIKDMPGSGSTLTAALIMDDQITTAHVGDTRIYMISPNGNPEVLTRDHSLVNRMIELGQLSKEDAITHPQRNVLYRALGQTAYIEPDVQTRPIPKGSSILLCSDGLWGVVKEEEIARLVNTTEELQQACQALINAANAMGGPDNISVVLVRLSG